MKVIAIASIRIILFFLISTSLFAQVRKGDSVTIHKSDTKAQYSLRDSIRKDSVDREIARRDSIKADTIPSYIVITDTVRTYPFTQDSLNKINIRALKRRGYILETKISSEEIAKDYCLYKPKYWSKSLEAILNLTETSFSPNWKSGGLNSTSALITVNGKTDYERYDVSFTNELQSQYGSERQKSLGLRKTTDRLYLDSKFAVKIKNPFYLFTAVNFQSQFAAGYNYTASANGISKSKISALLAPGYLTESLGLEYKPKPYFSLRFGLGAFRQTFVLDTSLHSHTLNNYGVPVGEKALTEAAFQFVGNFDKEIGKNVHLKALFQFFESYIHSTNTSSRLDLSLTAKVNRLLNVNFTGTALYDSNQDAHIQLTQLLSLGIAYRFSDFTP